MFQINIVKNSEKGNTPAFSFYRVSYVEQGFGPADVQLDKLANANE